MSRTNYDYAGRSSLLALRRLANRKYVNDSPPPESSSVTHRSRPSSPHRELVRLTEIRALLYRQCPWCGCGSDGSSAGAGETTCRRCHSSLIPDPDRPLAEGVAIEPPPLRLL